MQTIQVQSAITPVRRPRQATLNRDVYRRIIEGGLTPDTNFVAPTTIELPNDGGSAWECNYGTILPKSPCPDGHMNQYDHMFIADLIPSPQGRKPQIHPLGWTRLEDQAGHNRHVPRRGIYAWINASQYSLKLFNNVKVGQTEDFLRRMAVTRSHNTEPIATVLEVNPEDFELLGVEASLKHALRDRRIVVAGEEIFCLGAVESSDLARINSQCSLEGWIIARLKPEATPMYDFLEQHLIEGVSQQNNQRVITVAHNEVIP